MKDVRMAQDAGVLDAHAAYGEGLGREQYRLLQAVSHWTDEDMKREEALKAAGTVKPTIVLENSFAEILDYCTFDRHVSSAKVEGRA